MEAAAQTPMKEELREHRMNPIKNHKGIKRGAVGVLIVDPGEVEPGVLSVQDQLPLGLIRVVILNTPATSARIPRNRNQRISLRLRAKVSPQDGLSERGESLKRGVMADTKSENQVLMHSN